MAHRNTRTTSCHRSTSGTSVFPRLPPNIPSRQWRTHVHIWRLFGWHTELGTSSRLIPATVLLDLALTHQFEEWMSWTTYPAVSGLAVKLAFPSLWIAPFLPSPASAPMDSFYPSPASVPMDSFYPSPASVPMDSFCPSPASVPMDSFYPSPASVPMDSFCPSPTSVPMDSFCPSPAGVPMDSFCPPTSRCTNGQLLPLTSRCTNGQLLPPHQPVYQWTASAPHQRHLPCAPSWTCPLTTVTRRTASLYIGQRSWPIQVAHNPVRSPSLPGMTRHESLMANCHYPLTELGRYDQLRRHPSCLGACKTPVQQSFVHLNHDCISPDFLLLPLLGNFEQSTHGRVALLSPLNL